MNFYSAHAHVHEQKKPLVKNGPKAVPNRVAKAKAKLDFFLQYCSFATTVPNRVVKTKLNPPRRNT
jgi:hypothetical protein